MRSVRYRFGSFTLDEEAAEMRGPSGPVSLPPKHFALLALLLSRAPALVTKEEAFAAVWPGVVVEEANIHNVVSDLRRTLGEGEWIRTVHRKGYAFAGAVHRDGAPAPESRFELVRGRKRYPLRLGVNVLGREGDLDVPFDAAEVSRRHAAITVDDDRAVLEDLGSKNGTFLGRRRIEGEIVLQDGDEILIGSVVLVFRTRRGMRSPTVSWPR